MPGYPVCRGPAGPGVKIKPLGEVLTGRVFDLLQHVGKAVRDVEETQLALKEG